MSVPNPGNTAVLPMQNSAVAAGRALARKAAAVQLAERFHGALLRRTHLAAESIRSLMAAPDGTSGKHELADLTIDSENRAAGVHFLSTPWAVLRWVHAAAVASPDKSGWTFVDLGAGKGRAVLSAAAHSYRRIVGVEFAEELAALARINVDVDGHDPSRVTIVEGDASTFVLPDGPCVVFLFNPFGPPVLDRVIAQIVSRSNSSGHPVRVAYLNPVHGHLFAANPAFRRIPLSRSQFWRFRMLSPYRLELYETVPPTKS